jgi:DNA-directed RNA polymerase subunit RPC12/RpoP
MVIVGGPVFAGLFVVAAFALYRSPVVTHVNIAKEQPIPFSHQRHVEGNGIDCRYCHTSVETGAFAGIPPTETCMTCHSQVLGDQPIFDPLYASWETNEPIAWLRIHDVPDFVFFDHSIHVAQGIGCETCHGRIDEMPLTRKVNTLHMGWCLECHRQPEKFLRPRDEVFTMGYEPEESQKDMGARLLEAHGVEKGQLTNCSVCHR